MWPAPRQSARRAATVRGEWAPLSVTSPSEPSRSAPGERRPGRGNRLAQLDPRYAVSSGLALAVASLALGLMVSGAFTSRHKIVAAPVRVTLRAAAAASVFATDPNANHGKSGELRVDSSPIMRSYLRFDLSRLRGKVTRAKLSLDPLAGNPVGFAVDVVPAGWKEGEVTYATAPPARARIGLSGPLARGVRATIDVTRFVRGDGRELALALVGVTSQRIALAGLEHGALGPQLTVWLKGGYAARPRPGHASLATGHASLATAARAATAGIMAARRGHDPLIAAAGDIACDPAAVSYRSGNGTTNSCHDRLVSDMLLRIRPTAVLPLGDEQYDCGELSAFHSSYARTWGRLRAISHPVPGNHEYGEECGGSSAVGYFRYFGSIAGPFGRGWYSYDLGSWHLIALNSECSYGRGRLVVGGCRLGSREERWLRRDLATHRRRCMLGYWHEPRFSSGQHGDALQMARIWNDLAHAHADIVLSAHNHDYERFAPIGAVPEAPVATGRRRRPNFQEPVLNTRGIREFVVGTGGKNHYPFRHPPLRGEVVRNPDAYGLLLLRLRPRGFSWRFVPEPGKTFTDSGSAWCS
jgi:acid phosphatase type 7